MKKYDDATILDAPVEDVAKMLDSCLRAFDEHGRALFEHLHNLGNAEDYSEALIWLEDLG